MIVSVDSSGSFEYQTLTFICKHCVFNIPHKTEVQWFNWVNHGGNSNLESNSAHKMKLFLTVERISKMKTFIRKTHFLLSFFTSQIKWKDIFIRYLSNFHGKIHWAEHILKLIPIKMRINKIESFKQTSGCVYKFLNSPRLLFWCFPPSEHMRNNIDIVPGERFIPKIKFLPSNSFIFLHPVIIEVFDCWHVHYPISLLIHFFK